MHSLQENEWVPAKVPGSVYQAYLDAGKMEDPFYRDNEEKALNLMKQDFEFATTFNAEEALREADRTVLHFDGIDTLGEIYLNGTHLGDTENMHREWEFDVKELLKAEGNELRVILRSPVNYIYDSYEKDPLSVDCSDAMKGCSRLRKAHCMFGWDWGPRLPDAGIFREVKLLGITKARFDNVRISQKHVDGQVDLALFVGTETVTESPEPFAYRVTLTTPEGKSEVYGNSPASIHVEKPELWWPNGYGKQNLYGVKIELLDGEKVLDVWEKRIGLRTMTVAREKDQWGECFCHEVNGVRIFAMGADYIPEDNVLPRVTPERTRQLLTDARDCHFNCIRVWGGGYYPDDFFYDICDELGLIVWQDFMFACCSYDLTKEFEATITQEFIDNVKRIRHHASLGLWCGNNEMEMFIAGDTAGWCKKPSQLSDYFKMYEYIIPKVLEVYDPDTFYWPASPSSGGGFDAPNDENRGDVHYWDVWHGNKPITEFRKFYFRATGKTFYDQLMEQQYVAISATKDKIAVSLRGKIKNIGKKNLDIMFENNPYMKKIYPGDTKDAIEVFWLYEAQGEYFDISNPSNIVRDTITIRKTEVVQTGYYIGKECIGCKLCYSVCPQKCIDISSVPVVINQNHCLHCGRCAEICPKQCIEKRG